MLIHSKLKLPQGSFAFLQNSHSANQPEILAIHGWLDNAASFSNLIPLLPNYNWTALDLPGHGHSFHRPEHSHYHFIDYIGDIVDFIRARYDKPIVLVGHSLGGMLSTIIAGVYPELVEKLVLIDAAGLMTQSPKDGADELRLALDSRKPKKTFQDLNNGKVQQAAVNPKAAVRARLMSGDLSERAAELLVARNLKQQGDDYYWRSDNRLRNRSPIRLHESQAKSIIESITAPTLILLAEQGYPEIKQGFAHYQGHYRNLTCMNVPGGHHCHMDEPEGCAQLISRSLK